MANSPYLKVNLDYRILFRGLQNGFNGWFIPEKYPEKYPENINNTQKSIIDLIYFNKKISRKEIANKLGLSLEKFKYLKSLLSFMVGGHKIKKKLGIIKFLN